MMNTIQNMQTNNRNFYILLIADFISSLGVSMTNVAVTLEIYESTNNLMASAVFSVVVLAAQLIITPLMQKIRFSLEYRLIFSIGEGLCIIQVAVLFFIKQTLLIYVVFFIFSGLFFILECLRAEYLKVITADEAQQKRQGMTRFVNTLVTVIGPLIGGAILSAYSIRVVYIVDVIAYAFAAIAILFLKGNLKPSNNFDLTVSKRSILEMKKKADILIGTSLITFIGGATSILTLEYIYGILNADAFHYSVLMAAMALGGLIGNLAGVFQIFKNKLKAASFVCTLLMGVLLLSVLMKPGFYTLLIILTVSGTLSSVAMLYYSTELFIRSSSDRIRGEFAVFQNIIDVSSASAKPFGAAINKLIGCVYAITVMGVAFGISSFVTFLKREKNI